MGTERTPSSGRLEKRVAAVYPVHLTSDTRGPRAETAYTQNVSNRGARIVSRQKWSAEERIQVASIRWSFQATARVAYCEQLRGEEFAVGLQFLNFSLPLAGDNG